MQMFNNVLLIDDDAVSNAFNTILINTTKFAANVKSYLNARDAINYLKNLIKTNHPAFSDIIFLDITMPEMDGWEFLEELNKFPEFILKDCKVIFLTSSIDEEDIEKSKSYKIVHDFISKLITEDDLEELLFQQRQPM